MALPGVVMLAPAGTGPMRSLPPRQTLRSAWGRRGCAWLDRPAGRGTHVGRAELNGGVAALSPCGARLRHDPATDTSATGVQP